MLGLKEGQAAKTLLRPGSDDDTRREGREEEREKGKRKETVKVGGESGEKGKHHSSENSVLMTLYHCFPKQSLLISDVA